MFEHDANADGTVSRRSVLKLTGGPVAGSTALAGLGSERGAAATDDERPRADLRERNEDYVAVEVWFPQDTYDEIKPLNDVYLGDAEQFVIHDEEDTEGLANPVEMDFENPHEVTMYFRTDDVDLSGADGEEVTLGLGLFPERTIPGPQEGR